MREWTWAAFNVDTGMKLVKRNSGGMEWKSGDYVILYLIMKGPHLLLENHFK